MQRALALPSAAAATRLFMPLSWPAASTTSRTRSERLPPTRPGVVAIQSHLDPLDKLPLDLMPRVRE